MFYDRFEELCKEKGVKPGRACTEMGVSRSLAAKWKATGTEKPSAEALEKMSVYFGKSIEEILSGKTKKAPTPGNGDELDEILERLRARPECRMLFKLADGATPDDVQKAAAIIEALRKVEGK